MTNSGLKSLNMAEKVLFISVEFRILASTWLAPRLMKLDARTISVARA